MQEEPRSREGVRIDRTDVSPTVLLGPDRLPSRREAAPVSTHLGKHYSESCRADAC